MAALPREVRLSTAVASPLIGRKIPVRAADIPMHIARLVDAEAGPTWRQAYAPMQRQGGCRYGCNVYARRLRSGRIQYALMHFASYGHR